MGAYDYDVPGTVPVLAQTSADTCWAAAVTMLFSWRDSASYTQDQAMKKIGSKYVDLFTAGSKLLNTDVSNFIAASHLKGEPPTNYSIDQYLTFLKNYGPLWVGLNPDPSNPDFSEHVVIMTGMYGDGVPKTTFVRLNDPDGGIDYDQDFVKFVQRFESLAGVAGPAVLQVLHF